MSDGPDATNRRAHGELLPLRPADPAWPRPLQRAAGRKLLLIRVPATVSPAHCGGHRSLRPRAAPGSVCSSRPASPLEPPRGARLSRRQLTPPGGGGSPRPALAAGQPPPPRSKTPVAAAVRCCSPAASPRFSDSRESCRHHPAFLSRAQSRDGGVVAAGQPSAFPPPQAGAMPPAVGGTGCPSAVAHPVPAGWPAGIRPAVSTRSGPSTAQPPRQRRGSCCVQASLCVPPAFGGGNAVASQP